MEVMPPGMLSTFNVFLAPRTNRILKRVPNNIRRFFSPLLERRTLVVSIQRPDVQQWEDTHLPAEPQSVCDIIRVGEFANNSNLDQPSIEGFWPMLSPQSNRISST